MAGAPPPQAGPSAASVAFDHAYDATNRRVGQTTTDDSWWSVPSGASSTAYTTNNLNQYTAVGGASPTYDDNGNLTFDGTFTYAYDPENRLTSIVQGATPVASYAYDAQGRRKSRTVGSTTTIYVTDADNREVLEYDGATGQPLRWHSFGLGVDEPLNRMELAGATRATLIPDIQGSIVAELDAASGTLTTAGYQPYGENPNLAAAGYRYTARRLDPETAGSAAQPSGLYYYRARMYSPALGRFIQPDPIGYSGGRNLYVYAFNDPLNLNDETGLDPKDPSTGNFEFFVAVRPAVIATSPYFHASILIVDRNTYSGGISSLGGQAQGGGPGGIATLVSTPNQVDDLTDIPHLGRLFRIEVPSGQTLDDFATNLRSTASSYPNDQPYFPFPNLSPTNVYNSNGLVSGVILGAGGKVPVIPPYSLPGYNQPVPIIPSLGPIAASAATSPQRAPLPFPDSLAIGPRSGTTK